jgi:TRAG family protein
MGKMGIKLNEHQKNLILNYGVLTGLFFAWIVVVILFWNISSIVYISSVGLGIIWFLVIRSIFYKDGVGLKYFIGNSKENKEKDKKKRDSLKKVLTFEKEYVKKMGESGIASYDEQQKRDEANRKKITKFGFIMLIVSFLWLSIGTMIMAYKFGNQDIVTYIKKYTVYNDAQFPAVPMEFNEEQLKSIVGLAKSKADYEKAIKYHIENDIYYLTKPLVKLDKNLTEEQVIKMTRVPVKGLPKAIEEQQKLNNSYYQFLDKELPRKQDLIWKYQANTDPKIQKGVEYEKQNIEFLNKQRSVLEKSLFAMQSQVTEYEKAITKIDDELSKAPFWSKFSSLMFLGLIIFGYNIIGVIRKQQILKEEKELTTHGTARWARIEDMPKGKPAEKAFATDLLVQKGVILGKFNGFPLKDDSKTHILLSAPTRTGKGVSIIIPTLIDSWNESVFVLDIKGENYQLTSGYRKEKFNNKIIRLAPMSSESAKYNPMEEIRVAFEGGLQESEDIDNIASLISQSDDGGKADPFWDENGSIFIQALMTFTLYRIRQNGMEMYDKWGTGYTPSEEEKLEANRKASFADIAGVLVNPDNDMPLKEYFLFLGGINENISEKGNTIYGAKKGEMIKHFDPTDTARNEKLMEILKSNYATKIELINKGIHPNIQELFSKIATMSENMFGSVKAVGETKLKVFSTPIVKYNTSSSDFRVWDLMNYKTPVSLYLVIEPKDLKAMAALARILLIQIVNKLTGEMDYIGGGSHKWRLLFILDEFPAIGKMEVLDKAIGFVAGYGMKLMIILQSLDQLYKIYGKENGLVSNCQIQVYYTANENQSAEYISKTFGSETIKYKSDKQDKKGILTKETKDRKERALLNVSEVRSLPLSKILIVAGGKPPILTEKIQYFLADEYKGRTKIPYVLSEGLDSIVNYEEHINELSYKLTHEDEKDIINRYEVFYMPKNDIYGLESSFYRYYKTNYVLKYFKQPLIFGKYEKNSRLDGTFTVKVKGFVGDLLNNYDFEADDKAKKKEVLKRARTKLIKTPEDIFATIERSDSSEYQSLMKNSLNGSGAFSDKNHPEPERIFGYDNYELFEKTISLNNYTRELEKDYSNFLLPINSCVTLDVETTSDKRAEVVFYGALLFDGVLETLLKLNTLNFNKDKTQTQAEGAKREGQSGAKLILGSAVEFENWLFNGSVNNQKVLNDFIMGYTDNENKHSFKALLDEQDNLRSLQEIARERKHEFYLELNTNEKTKGLNEDEKEKLSTEMMEKSWIFVLSEFEVKDPQTERMIPFEIYVPIPMKVCYIDSNKVGNLDKQVIANMIMRNLLHFLRNNNGTWNKLQKDVLFSEEAWKKLNDNTQTRKSAIKPAI